jgi:hypothetical protein
LTDLIIKPERDRDLYMVWSTIVEAPLAFGPRSYVENWLLERYLKQLKTTIKGWLDQVEVDGSSSDDPGLHFDGDGDLIYMQEGLLPRSKIVELLQRLGGTDEKILEMPDVGDLLDPLD